ncbi:glycosyltransferase [Stenotrophomonas phage Siara]|uniref:Glycosyltransferase n=1 Tax=Stenotrophomonas phage Siara TaxID=2859658 RepID=A0AAE8BI85_9CAUD|nr:glycosyltransferase [Stenotrophomonas phage Siara]QYW02022.1 glycosyltransferase [Stenotrophomonas phage Siara]
MDVKVEANTMYRVKMDMTAKDAGWLKAILQNAAGPGEPAEATNIRAAIFRALDDAGVE